MEMLSNGSSGDAVTALQRKLFAFGFDPGTIDGIFGPKTDQAVRRYQEQKGLQVDGIAGPETFASLGMMSDEKPAAVETSAAPERPPMASASAATGGIDAQRSTEAADDKPASPPSKGLRARMAARREARRNRGR
jgi:peptidoglycan hydrolase-like protein with peptidoglycan-binding domain